MFCVIVGVFIVVGSDSTQTYHVAVSSGICQDVEQRADLVADRWLFGGRPDICSVFDQYFGLLI